MLLAKDGASENYRQSMANLDPVLIIPFKPIQSGLFRCGYFGSDRFRQSSRSLRLASYSAVRIESGESSLGLDCTGDHQDGQKDDFG